MGRSACGRRRGTRCSSLVCVVADTISNKSIKTRRSAIGYIAKCVVHVGNGETDEGCQVCDIAFLRCPSEHLSLFLLVKVRNSARPWSSFSFIPFQAVVLFMAGEHVNAMSRMNDLITDAWVDPALYVVQVRERCSYIGNVTPNVPIGIYAPSPRE